MFKTAIPMFFRVETPLHVGSGQDLGVVDLPIQREKHTGYPKVEASGLKGSIREVFEEFVETLAEKYRLNNDVKLWEHYKDILETEDASNKPLIGKIENELENKQRNNGNFFDEMKKYIVYPLFGPENGGDFAGALGFSDARIFLFPVKSVKGVFALITCPNVLKRLKRDLEILQLPSKSTFKEKRKKIVETIENIGKPTNEEFIGFPDDLFVDEDKKRIVLEEYTFVKKERTRKQISFNDYKDLFKSIGVEDELIGKIVILSDDDFKDFVTLSTDIVTRTKIDNATGTVARGQLFTEEYLPPETMMYFIIFASPIFANSDENVFKGSGESSKAKAETVMNIFMDILPDIIQIGGNATLGKGIVKIIKPK